MMELVSPETMTEEDHRIRRILQQYPVLAYHLTFIINGYRDQVKAGIEAMDEAGLDTADAQIACAKRDWALYRYGIPTLETPEDWEAIRVGLREAYEEEDRKRDDEENTEETPLPQSSLAAL